MTRKSVVGRRGQANGENGSGARRAVHFDRAVVIFDDFLRDVETEAGATLALLGREIRIENLAHLRRVDSGAGILHADVDVKIFARCNRSVTAPFFSADAWSALIITF